MRTKKTQQLNNLLAHWHFAEDEDLMHEKMLSNDLSKFHTHW